MVLERIQFFSEPILKDVKRIRSQTKTKYYQWLSVLMRFSHKTTREYEFNPLQIKIFLHPLSSELLSLCRLRRGRVNMHQEKKALHIARKYKKTNYTSMVKWYSGFGKVLSISDPKPIKLKFIHLYDQTTQIV